MKKLLTMLTVLAILVASITVLSVSVFAKDEKFVYTGKVEDVTALVEAVDASAGSASDKVKNVRALWNYLRLNTVDPSAEGYDAMAEAAVKALAVGAVLELNTYSKDAVTYIAKIPVSYASQYLKVEFVKAVASEVEGEEPTTVKIGAGSTPLADIADLAIPSCDGIELPDTFVTVADYFGYMKGLMDAKLEAAKEALYSSSPLDEQGLTGGIISNDFNSDTTTISVSNGASSGATSYITYTDETKSDGYYTLDFTHPSESFANSGWPYTGTYWKVDSSFKRGAVFQFDYTYFSAASSLNLSTTEDGHATGARTGSTFAKFENGKVSVGSNTATTECIVPGEWTNIALVIDLDTLLAKLYVDYEYLGEVVCMPSSDTITVTHVRMNIGARDVTFSIDNGTIYEGSMPRDLTMLSSMTQDERFKYYADYLPENILADGVHFPSVLFAYNEMQSYISNYWIESSAGDATLTNYKGQQIKGMYFTDDEGLREAVKLYYAFDPTVVKDKMKEQYTNEYIELVDSLDSLARTYSTLSEREKVIKSINDFAEKNGQYLDNANSEYIKSATRFDVLVKEAENDAKSFSFVTVAEYYSLMKGYTRKLSYYNEMVSVWKSAGGTDEKCPYDLTINDTRLESAIDIYKAAPSELYVLLCDENSKTLILYLLPTVEYKTAESWVENYDTISGYLKKARPIIKSGDYNPNYGSALGDLNELIDWYYVIDEYFYVRLQEEHLAVLSVMNEEYKDTDKYIAKLGAFNRMKKYFNENDIDYEDTKIKSIWNEYLGYEDELKTLDAEYAELLDNNAKAFVSIVRTLPVTTGYLEIKAAVESAATYYYNMTVGADEVNAAVEIYLAYYDYIAKVESSTEQLVMLMDAYDSAANFAERYAILSTAANIVVYVDTDVSIMAGDEGNRVDIAKYIEKYDGLAAEYNVVKNAVNGEVNNLAEIICSLRANCESAGIIAYFRELSK